MAWSAQFVVSRNRILANSYDKYAYVDELMSAPKGHWIHDVSAVHLPKFHGKERKLTLRVGVSPDVGTERIGRTLEPGVWPHGRTRVAGDFRLLEPKDRARVQRPRL